MRVINGAMLFCGCSGCHLVAKSRDRVVEPNGSGEIFVGLLGGSIASENVKFSKKFYSLRITKAALQKG